MDAEESSEGSAATEPASPPPNKRMRHSSDNINHEDAAVGEFRMIFET